LEKYGAYANEICLEKPYATSISQADALRQSIRANNLAERVILVDHYLHDPGVVWFLKALRSSAALRHLLYVSRQVEFDFVESEKSIHRRIADIKTVYWDMMPHVLAVLKAIWGSFGCFRVQQRHDGSPEEAELSNVTTAMQFEGTLLYGTPWEKPATLR